MYLIILYYSILCIFLILHLLDCGGWQSGEGGVISSPNYPDHYPGPSRCAWLLEAPEGHTITVSWL